MKNGTAVSGKMAPAAAKDRTDPIYRFIRIVAVVSIFFLFFPGLNPARICGLIKKNISLFTTGVSYSALTNGFGKAFRKAWVTEATMRGLQFSSLAIIIGIIAQCAASVFTTGSNRMKRISTLFVIGGTALSIIGSVGIYLSYLTMTTTIKPQKVLPEIPGTFFAMLVITALMLIAAVLAMVLGKRSKKGDPVTMPSKFQLFAMCLPFIILCFLFGYLPLYGWRYAFFDYKAGGTLSLDNFVGTKWFTYLFTNDSTRSDIIRVMKNTLGISGLGIATSWCSMAFAIFLNEIKNQHYRRFVQTFTTIPNFISWVLIFAIATAIFSSDGFISSLMVNAGIWKKGVNMLANGHHVWLQMLAWSLWKGLGWGAIVYIAAISGIDQSLYEAANVDGAGRFAKMWYITVPELIPTYMVMLLMAVANILNNGMDQYLVFENSANSANIMVLDLYVYKLGIGSGLIPLSTAIGMLKSVVSVILLFVANGISKVTRGSSII
ncbi:MAG: ABC transporter permease subunit [Lachnospiraceae bacterium]|jgi:putative aldouronate transport system permease protein|nr:ABC transporter permease subunit [Lachnospiraceae bacterium]MCH4063835.1 ABC transporter permease subunit [Lachnospiraceae bacterium]MCH4103443.1 ABC transporter permease subunit [Lachnospiraceae bacterium]MCI1309391.1 ABC transporter permease subunit [Lachnospiraceae bacterium]MCI1333754.1 ABC transporter permease subunit [Lachnospiraceae bacterium]